MDNYPLARRPHKSPAHTVKDLGAGLSAFPLPRPAAPKCPREPTTIQRISIPSTPCRHLFRRPRRRSARPFGPLRATGPRILQLLRSSSTALQKPLLQPRPASVFHLGGARIVHMHNADWKRFRKIISDAPEHRHRAGRQASAIPAMRLLRQQPGECARTCACPLRARLRSPAQTSAARPRSLLRQGAPHAP